MRHAIYLTIVATLFSGLTGCSELADSTRQVSRSIDDANINNDVANRIDTDRARDTMTNVTVKTADGIVYLTGTVPNARAEQLAIGIVRDVRGVRDVVSSLQTEGTAARADDRRGNSGAQITSQVQDRIAMDGARASLSDVTVTTNRGTVKLTGTVPDATAKQRAGQLAREISGVRNVIDNLETVAPGATQPAERQFTSAEWDGVITLAVLKALADRGNRAYEDVTVRTTGRTVYLSGHVANAANKDRATELANNVGGVQRVVNNLQTMQTRGSRNSNFDQNVDHSSRD